LDRNVIVHCPAAFVFAPTVVHVPVGVVCAAPFESTSEKSTCSPAAGPNPAPLPRSFSSVTVNVCGWPTSFVAAGAIGIRALTHVFWAGPELAPVPSVSRWTDRPASDTVVCALTVVCPVVLEVSVIVQEPEVPTVRHGFGVVNEPGPLSIVKLIG